MTEAKESGELATLLQSILSGSSQVNQLIHGIQESVEDLEPDAYSKVSNSFLSKLGNFHQVLSIVCTAELFFSGHKFTGC